jgi:hypothetical protein
MHGSIDAIFGCIIKNLFGMSFKTIAATGEARRMTGRRHPPVSPTPARAPRAARRMASTGARPRAATPKKARPFSWLPFVPTQLFVN